MPEFERRILNADTTNLVAAMLQQRLVDLIDLSLLLKQAHWAVVGRNFRPVHLQLDEILDDVREASDEIAERMATLGVVPDGRASTVVKSSQLQSVDAVFTQASATISLVADLTLNVIVGLRESIDKLGDPDPVSQDMLIAIAAPLEKHLWMLQAQEL